MFNKIFIENYKINFYFYLKFNFYLLSFLFLDIFKYFIKQLYNTESCLPLNFHFWRKVIGGGHDSGPL
jgi:hypothetical protein